MRSQHVSPELLGLKVELRHELGMQYNAESHPNQQDHKARWYVGFYRSRPTCTPTSSLYEILKGNEKIEKILLNIIRLQKVIISESIHIALVWHFMKQHFILSSNEACNHKCSIMKCCTDMND